MKNIVMGLAFFACSFTVLAGESIDKTLTVNGSSYVRIEHINGTADIQSWDKAEVKISGTLGDRTDKFIFEKDGNDVLIKVKVKKSNGWGSWGSDEGDDLRIFVPRTSKLNYSAVNADVEISDVAGGVDMETVNGSIHAKKLAGRIRLESVNGEIKASGLQGNVRVETVNGNIISQESTGKEDNYSTVNGNIWVETNAQELKAETVNGNIQLKLQKVNQLNLETVNGSVEASMYLNQGGEVNASTVGGTVQLSFQDGLSARFDIQAHAGGSIANKLTDDKVQKDKYGPSRWLEFALNGGNAKVNISTVSGSVKIE